jgi:hypothetical protein
MSVANDLEPVGIDRRSALKKVAVGGAVAWAAPTVLSSRVSAQEACTLKCAPIGGLSVSVDILIAACVPGTAVVGTIADIELVLGSCGCGGTPLLDLVDIVLGAEVVIQTDPSASIEFDLDVSISCLDRLLRPITLFCTVTFTGAGDVGTCVDRLATIETFTATAACGAPQCGN